MLLLRGATSRIRHIPARSLFQYMLLLRGATFAASSVLRLFCFNTCSSCEEQPRVIVGGQSRNTFQYMLLLRGATSCGDLKPLQRKFQYMLLLRGATLSAFDHS